MEGLVEAMNEGVLAAVEHAGRSAVNQCGRNGDYAHERAGRSKFVSADFVSAFVGQILVGLDDLAGYSDRAAEYHASAQAAHAGDDERAVNDFFYAVIRCQRRCYKTSCHDC